MPIRSVTLRILGDATRARADIDWVNAAADKIEARQPELKFTADITDPTAKLQFLRENVAALTDRVHTIKVDAESKQALMDFALINANLAKLNRTVAKPKVSLEGMYQLEAGIAAADMALDKLSATEDKVLFKGWLASSGTGFLGLWGAKLRLFGGLLGDGALGTVGAIHLIVDGFAELAAVVIPATIAMTAFGIAGSDAANNIYRQMTAVHTVMDATQTSIYPMTGAMESLHQAIQPKVYQLFGDALTIMNSKTGAFRQLAMGTGTVLDQLAARLTLAVTHGQGLGTFMSHAIPDVQKFGSFILSLGGALGHVFNAMPGYAEIFLSLLSGFARGLEIVTGWIEPLLRWGLAAHGVWLYGGLMATAVVALINYLPKLILLVRGLATDLVGLATNPLTWVFVAVAALGAFIFWVSTAKTKTQEWVSSLEAGVQQAASVAQGVRLIGEDTRAVFNQLVSAEGQYNIATEQAAKVSKIAADSLRGEMNPAVQTAKTNIDALKSAMIVFGDSQNLVNYRMDLLARKFGGMKAAEVLVNEAGITMNQMLDKTPGALATIIQEVDGVYLGYKAMGQQAGVTGNDVQVLYNQMTDQYAAIQKLNSAMDTWIGTVTGGQNAFDTFAQGMHTLSQNEASAQKGTVTVTQRLGELTGTAKLTGRAMDGLGAGSLALNQAFAQQVNNANALIDAWRTANISGHQFTQSVKDIIAPLMQYAKGSQEATDQLVALAEEAGYKGPASFQVLNQWLGNTHDAMARVKQTTNDATQAEALLTDSMNAQSKLMASQLLNVLDQAELKYSNVTKAVQAYGKALAQSGQGSDAANKAAATLTQTIITEGIRTGQTKAAIAGMISTILHIPIRRAFDMVMSASGVYSVHNSGGVGHPVPGGTPHSAATGMLVDPGHYGGGDRHLIMAESGEAIVPKHLTQYVAPFLKAHGVPGFAAGGYIPGGETGNVFSGQWAVNSYNSFQSTFTNAMANAVYSAIKAATLLAQQGGPTGGFATANLVNVGRYMFANGYSRSAAAGIASCVAGESGGDPLAQGSGGRGLIGWTPPGKLPDSAFIPGNPTLSFNRQLPQILLYNRTAGGSISGLNSIANPVAAADYYSQNFERPAVTNSDVRPSVAIGVYHSLGGKAYYNGGIINEPVLGMGLRSGVPYSFGEFGSPELVTPLRGGSHFSSGGDVCIQNFYLLDDLNDDAQVRRLITKVNKYKTRHGNQPTGMG